MTAAEITGPARRAARASAGHGPLIPGRLEPMGSPKNEYAALMQEGIVFEAKNALITQRSRRFSQPGRVSLRRMRSSVGRFIVTNSRIYARGWFLPIMNIACNRSNVDLFDFKLEGRRITISIPEVRGVMGPGFSGDFSVSITSDRAERLMHYFEALGRTV